MQSDNMYNFLFWQMCCSREQKENSGVGFLRISNKGSPVVHWIAPQLFITFDDMVRQPEHTHLEKHRKNCECCPCHSLFKGHCECSDCCSQLSEM